jgi:para-aminobenzoate synthetase component I
MFLRKDQIADKISEYVRKQVSFVFVIDFSGTRGVVLTPEDAAREGIFFSTPGFSNRAADLPGPTPGIDFKIFPIEFHEYEKSFNKVISHLLRGDTYLLNLTFPTRIKTGLTLNDIFIYSSAPYKLLFQDKFVVFSPEIFIRTTGNRIRSFPMKGTIDASVQGAKEKILADEKEFFEHNTIVDLIRNDLSMISSNVKVDRFRYVETVITNRKTLLQVSSEISGTLLPEWNHNAGKMLLSILPAGSVTGAPKEKTVEIINSAETYDRGFYTGIFGFFDGRDLDSAVMIRFIENQQGDMIFKSGGGITALSNLEEEYEELNNKVYVPFI